MGSRRRGQTKVEGEPARLAAAGRRTGMTTLQADLSPAARHDTFQPSGQYQVRRLPERPGTTDRLSVARLDACDGNDFVSVKPVSDQA